MGVQGLLQIITESPDFHKIRAGLQRGISEQAVVGLVGSQKASYIAGVWQEVVNGSALPKRPLFVITYTAYQAERLHTNLLRLFLKRIYTSFLPRMSLSMRRLLGV